MPLFGRSSSPEGALPPAPQRACWPRFSGSDQEGGVNDVKAHLYWFTLRFHDARTEREFGRHAREGLPDLFFFSNLVCFGMACGVMGLARVWEVLDSAVWDDYYPGAALDQVFVCVGIVSLLLFNMMIMKVKRIATSIPFRVLEVYIVSNILVLVVFAVLVQPHYLGRVKGYPLPEVADDTNLLLLLTILAIVSHQINSHVRWLMMLPVQICCILGYTIPAVLLGPDPWIRVLLFSVEMTGLLWGASNATRMLEIHVRAQFLNLLEERTRRVQSEFQLSRITHSQRGPARGTEETRSTAESVPTTTESGQILDISKDLDPQRWDGILNLGKKEQWLVNGAGLSWKREDILGAGGFGIVVKGYYEGIGVAIKVPRAPPTTRNKSHLMEACNELQILRRLRHPHIVSFYGAWLDERHNDLALVLELVDGVSLQSFVQGCPSNGGRAQVISQVSRALHYLHGCNPRVVHGDLKDSNIFVESRNSKCVAKLLDFGLARRITKRARPMGGTLLWVAPEVVQNSCSPDTAADVFSLGRIVYFVVTGNVPGESVTAEALRMDLKTGVLPALVWPEEAFALEYRALADSCNQAIPSSRPQIQELHDAFMQIWEQYEGMPQPCQHPMDPDLHKEVQALRKAASAWKSKRSKSNGQHVRAFTVAGPTPRFSLEGTPEDSSTRATSDATTRMYPDFDLTSVDTQTAILAPALARCNFGIDSRACCHFHAAVQNLRNVVNSLTTKRCGTLAVTPVGQCQHCGAMVTDDDLSCGSSGEAHQCDICGESVRLRNLIHQHH